MEPDGRLAKLYREREGMERETAAVINFTDWQIPGEPVPGRQCKRQSTLVFEFPSIEFESGDNLWVHIQTILAGDTYPPPPEPNGDVSWENCPNLLMP
jgi:hypothetical protein